MDGPEKGKKNDVCLELFVRVVGEKRKKRREVAQGLGVCVF